MLDETNDKARSGERPGVVGAGLDRRSCVVEGGLFVRLVQPATHITVFVRISRCGIGRGIIGLEGQGLVEECEGPIGVTGHGRMKMGQGAQVEVVGVEAVRALKLGSIVPTTLRVISSCTEKMSSSARS